ncbi:acyltransferase [bacterium]|nr:acyltransferase [bacterium]
MAHATASVAARPDARPRVLFIDVFKGLLVLGMIYGHAACLLGVREVSVARAVMGILSVFTFPGFLFCFGYATDLAYLSRPLGQVWRRLLVTGLRILLAFYISAACFRLLVSETVLSPAVLGRIVTLSDVAPYSEFLIAFALYMLLALVCFKPIRALLERPPLFWGLMVALLGTTLIPYDRIRSVHLGLLIGTAATPTYPVVQFAPYFLIGAFFHRHQLRVSGRVVALSAICSSVLTTFYLSTHAIPSNYPPSLVWVLGAPLALCLVYRASDALAARRGVVRDAILRFGQNALFGLLASNLMLFALERVWPGHQLQPAGYVIVAVALIVVIYYLLLIVRFVPPPTGE